MPTPPRPLIAYCRVSTARQGKSGLGLEAQREAIARFAVTEGFVIVGEYVDVETGRARPPAAARRGPGRGAQAPLPDRRGRSWIA
jgi:hypothetical protein